MKFFKKAIEDMAAESLRCVAIAYRLYEMDNVPASEEERAQWSLPEDNLVLLAIVGLKVCFLFYLMIVLLSFLIKYLVYCYYIII